MSHGADSSNGFMTFNFPNSLHGNNIEQLKQITWGYFVTFIVVGIALSTYVYM